jgi:hypothetical protein
MQLAVFIANLAVFYTEIEGGRGPVLKVNVVT